jgi:predicted nucleotide-binding protein (sugar kinase/HSP70/actin superfamily)
MYWYYGQQVLKAAAQVKAHPNLFACMITNFSCAPDSFILHHLRWTQNAKPALILELDSHTADAGLDTRIEAFLDIIDGYRTSQPAERPMLPGRDWEVRLDSRGAAVRHRTTGEVRPLTDSRVTLVWPSMGRRAVELVSRVARRAGIDSAVQRTPNAGTLARARAVASGKECVPALLVLGSFLEYFASRPAEPDRVHLLFMPMTTGPCRTGQYATYYQNLFEELGHRNVAVLSLNSDNSYGELGPALTRQFWFALVLADCLKEIEYALRALAADRPAALAAFEAVWGEVLDSFDGGAGPVTARLAGWADRLAAIPLARPIGQAPQVLVIGEIFVRQDEYSVETLVDTLARHAIVPRVEGLAEWVHYVDWQQRRRLRRALGALPAWRRAFSPQMRQYAALGLEIAWKRWMEHRVRRRLGACGLLGPAPPPMDHVMRCAGDFASPDLDSEAILSPCAAKLAVEAGVNGVAIIAPFACLPGRVIEALFAPWARARGVPVICLENDGNQYPANVMSRLEVFATQASRTPARPFPAPRVSLRA